MNALLASLLAFAGFDESPDLLRFPDATLSALNAAEARRHAEWARGQAGASRDVPEFGWRDYADRAELVAVCWRWLALAHGCPDPWPAVWSWPLVWDHEPLEQLRRLIGEEDYSDGRMPPVYPPRR